MHNLTVQEPMAPEIYAQIQAQRRKARQQIEAAKDQRFFVTGTTPTINLVHPVFLYFHAHHV